jgi:hypothetical protein
MVKVNWLLQEAELADLDLEKEWTLFRLTNFGYQADLIQLGLRRKHSSSIDCNYLIVSRLNVKLAASGAADE